MPGAIRRGILALIRTTSAADNPPSGQRLLVPKSDGWYDRDAAGVETNLNSSGSTQAELDARYKNVGELVTNAELPARLSLGGGVEAFTDWNNYVDTGWYFGTGLANAPGGIAGWWQMMVHQLASNTDYVVQVAYTSSAATHGIWTRSKAGGTWGAWTSYYTEVESDDRYARSTGGGMEKYTYVSAATGTVTIDLNLYSTYEIGASGNITIAFSNIPPTMTSCTVTVTVYGNGTGYTITPPANSRIMGAAIPTTTSAKFVTLTLWTPNGGSWWQVSAVKEV